MTDERHVLVIFPHPDDETFSSAGTIASYIEKGIPCLLYTSPSPRD